MEEPVLSECKENINRPLGERVEGGGDIYLAV